MSTYAVSTSWAGAAESTAWVVDAGGRASVVHQLAHIAAALPHARKPGFYEGTQVIALRAQPCIDRGSCFTADGKRRMSLAGRPSICARVYPRTTPERRSPNHLAM
jgi:hypothetical protein